MTYFQINFGSLGFRRFGFFQVSCVEPCYVVFFVHFKTSLHHLQSFTRTCETFSGLQNVNLIFFFFSFWVNSSFKSGTKQMETRRDTWLWWWTALRSWWWGVSAGVSACTAASPPQTSWETNHTSNDLHSFVHRITSYILKACGFVSSLTASNTV